MKARWVEDGVLEIFCPGCEQLHQFDRGYRAFNYDFERPKLEPVRIILKGKDHPRHGDYPAQICHFVLRAGKICFMGDSTHPLSAQTVDLPNLQ